MNPRDFVEIEIAGMTFRTRKERTLLSESMIQRALFKDGTLLFNELIKADCEIFDRVNSAWLKVTDKDIEEIPRSEGVKLLEWINKIRGDERDFYLTQS